MREHRESHVNQRALVDRALPLGRPQERIVVLDAALGPSAATAAGRDAVKTLAAEVALGPVGIGFGWEGSRLARNNADWDQLLDLAALVGTLLGDGEGGYEPRLYHDRLLLGLTGTMSEAEVHSMRPRRDAGRLRKVARGESGQHLPTGLVRLADGRVGKAPARQVPHVIMLDLPTCDGLGSCQQTLRCFQQQGLLWPRRQTRGFYKGELLWRKPSAAASYEIPRNPA